MDEVKIRIGDEQVSGLSLRPPNAKALYLFAHGAGVGMTHRSMDSNARELAERGIATLRYQFPYMEKGSMPRCGLRRLRQCGSRRIYGSMPAAGHSVGA
jgi:predicted alpha/beta-hydrolase family hydrolase